MKVSQYFKRSCSRRCSGATSCSLPVTTEHKIVHSNNLTEDICHTYFRHTTTIFQRHEYLIEGFHSVASSIVILFEHVFEANAHPGAAAESEAVVVTTR